MAYFSDVVANLVEADMTNMKNSKHAMQKKLDVESLVVHKKMQTDYH